MAQQPANDDNARRAFATHDYTTTAGAPTTLNERWVDVKTPGGLLSTDGDTYVAGTIEVNGVQLGGNTFSGAPVFLPLGANPFTNFAQIGIVQRRGADQTILHQTYFYGTSPGIPGGPTWLNVRAISVWPAPTTGETRVAICGETVDQTLPCAAALPAATPLGPTGFVAVFDGQLNLKWSYRFFTTVVTERCAITDLAIHVEDDAGVTYDVVTYCGISTHGNPGAGTTLSPLMPFAAPSGSGGYVAGGGSTNAGQGFWDGIVGRVRFDRSAGVASPYFHSIVGGSGADGLFGITLLDRDTIAVVGNTKNTSGLALAVAYPFYEVPMPAGAGVTWNSLTNYSVGTLSVFDASPIRTGAGNLVLVASEALGRANADGEQESIALDVWAAPFPVTGDHSIFVVGITNDSTPAVPADLIDSLDGGACARGAQPTHGGGEDGFVVHAVYAAANQQTSTAIDFADATFHGGAGNEGLTGVAGWSGVFDSCAVVGYEGSTGAGSNTDITATSVWHLGQEFVRTDTAASSNRDLPTSLGTSNTTALGYLPYPMPLGPVVDSPAGGGIAVDARFRASIVGTTLATGATTPFPVVGGFGPSGGNDAVRVVYDMLPKNVWRTDGTGTRAAAFGSVPQPATSGYNGGTTPVPCLATYGQLPGQAAPEMRRVWIDYHGAKPAAGLQPTVTVSTPQPTVGPIYTVGLVQLGFLSPFLGLYGSTTELWTYNSPQVLSAGGNLVWPIPALPSGSFEFVVQGVFLLSAPMACDPGASIGTIMSPGLVLSY